jgi:hypothetical protein
VARSIAIGVPCWQSVATPFFASVWQDLEIPPGTPKRVIEGNLVAEQHERIARWFVEETTADILLLLEQDHRFPPNLLERVANYTDAVVGALYWTRNEPYFPVALVPMPELWESPGVWEGQWEGIQLTPLWPSLEDGYREGGQLESVCAVGMGCIAIQREVLEEWPKSEPYFRDHYQFDRWWTDDVWFCCRARQLGHGVYVDCGLELPHMALREVGHRERRAYLERRAMELGVPIR